MTRQLPPSPSLTHLKNQAKDLLNEHKRGDESCCAVLGLHRRFEGRKNEEILASKVGLREVQHALALDYGAKSWADLRKRVLFECIKAGNMSKVQEWVSSGSDIDARTEINETPLIWAASFGHLEMVKYLIENGADVNAQYDAGNTPLIVASWYGHLPVVEYLVIQGADVAIRNLGGHQAIHWAAEHGHLDIVKFLQASGADIHSTGNTGANLLTEACEDGHLEIAEYAIAEGVDIESDRATRDGFTPLVAASYKGYANIVRFLLDRGANIHVGDDAPLEWACLHGQLGTAELLVSRGANVNGTGGDGHTILEKMANDNRYDVVKFLIGHGADPNLPGEDGETAMDAAVRNGHAELIDLFRGAIE